MDKLVPSIGQRFIKLTNSCTRCRLAAAAALPPPPPTRGRRQDEASNLKIEEQLIDSTRREEVEWVPTGPAILRHLLSPAMHPGVDGPFQAAIQVADGVGVVHQIVQVLVVRLGRVDGPQHRLAQARVVVLEAVERVRHPVHGRQRRAEAERRLAVDEVGDVGDGHVVDVGVVGGDGGAAGVGAVAERDGVLPGLDQLQLLGPGLHRHLLDAPRRRVGQPDGGDPGRVAVAPGRVPPRLLRLLRLLLLLLLRLGAGPLQLLEWQAERRVRGRAGVEHRLGGQHQAVGVVVVGGGGPDRAAQAGEFRHPGWMDGALPVLATAALRECACLPAGTQLSSSSPVAES